MKRKFLIYLGILSLNLIILACIIGDITNPSPTLNPAVVFTAVGQTAAALRTRAALGTKIVTSTRTLLPWETPEPTFNPNWTASPPPTLTTRPRYPTTRPKYPTPIPTNLPCNSMRFVSDVTVKDGSTFAAGERFSKTWQVINTGSCTWTQDYALVFAGGDMMTTQGDVLLNQLVYPGQTANISVSMRAPDQAGEYTSYWKLRSPTGEIFGYGANAANAFWAKIVVMEEATPRPGTIFDFDVNYCLAEWNSSRDDHLPCPGDENFQQGSVYRLNTPRLEGGYTDNEPAIITIPSSGNGGFITGKFPPIRISPNYRFTSLIGCLDYSPQCNVQFQLYYSANGGPVQNLGLWNEVSDGKTQVIDIDLNFLMNYSVEFYMKVINNGSSVDDRAFWMAPLIRYKAPTPTPSFTPLPTATTIPPTVAPPTAIPPTAIPPTAEPPTAEPPTVAAPTVEPPTAEPTLPLPPTDVVTP